MAEEPDADEDPHPQTADAHTRAPIGPTRWQFTWTLPFGNGRLAPPERGTNVFYIFPRAVKYAFRS